MSTNLDLEGGSGMLAVEDFTLPRAILVLMKVLKDMAQWLTSGSGKKDWKQNRQRKMNVNPLA